MSRWRGRRGAGGGDGSARLFRALLWLYPPSLRRAYGEEMARLFRETLRDEVARGGSAGALWAWGGALADLSATIPREWPDELRRMRRQRRVRGRRETAMSRAAHTVLSGSVVYGPARGVLSRMNNDKFEKFTERARKVMSFAQEEAQRFNHNYIGTEHLLLGLVREGDGVAAKVLMNLGVELYKVRAAVEFIIGRGDRIVLGEIGMTPRAKKVIELGVDEARRLNHHYVGTEHILLGLVREGEGIAAGVLESLGVNLEKVRTMTLQVLNQSGGEPVVRYPGSPARSGLPPADFRDFSERGRAIIAAMLTEARARGQRDAGTGHALLALLVERDSLAAWMLTQAGIDVDAARRALERDLGPRTQTPAHEGVGLDTHALRMIGLAEVEAMALNQRFVGPEHLLLGIIAEFEGLGGQVMLELAADLNQLRQLSLQRPPKEPATTASGPALNRLTLLCRDVEATARFYMDQLGAASIAPEPVTRKYNLRLPGGGPILALREGSPDTPPQSGVTLDVWVRALDLAWRTLSDVGAADLAPISENGEGRHFMLPDPDGRLVRVFQAEAPTAQ